MRAETAVVYNDVRLIVMPAGFASVTLPRVIVLARGISHDGGVTGK